VTAETITPNDEAIAPCDHQRQLDHIDEMAHRIIGFLDEIEPHLPRLRTLLNPGAAMRGKFGGKRG
jgi:hypothetical protein